MREMTTLIEYAIKRNILFFDIESFIDNTEKKGQNIG